MGKIENSFPRGDKPPRKHRHHHRPPLQKIENSHPILLAGEIRIVNLRKCYLPGPCLSVRFLQLYGTLFDPPVSTANNFSTNSTVADSVCGQSQPMRRAGQSLAEMMET
jgi:hypothetical protein